MHCSQLSRGRAAFGRRLSSARLPFRATSRRDARVSRQQAGLRATKKPKTVQLPDEHNHFFRSELQAAFAAVERAFPARPRLPSRALAG